MFCAFSGASFTATDRAKAHFQDGVQHQRLRPSASRAPLCRLPRRHDELSPWPAELPCCSRERYSATRSSAGLLPARRSWQLCWPLCAQPFFSGLASYWKRKHGDEQHRPSDGESRRSLGKNTRPPPRFTRLQANAALQQAASTYNTNGFPPHGTPFAMPNRIGNGAMSHLVTPGGAETGTAAP